MVSLYPTGSKERRYLQTNSKLERFSILQKLNDFGVDKGIEGFRYKIVKDAITFKILNPPYHQLVVDYTSQTLNFDFGIIHMGDFLNKWGIKNSSFKFLTEIQASMLSFIKEKSPQLNKDWILKPNTGFAGEGGNPFIRFEVPLSEKQKDLGEEIFKIYEKVTNLIKDWNWPYNA